MDPQNGTLSFIGHQTEGIKTPRNFSIDPTGQFLVVANQDADTVIVFRIDLETGALRPTGTSVDLGMPVCVKFLARGK